MLPPAAGPRGAVPPVSPAGYNPFLVSDFSLNPVLPAVTWLGVWGWGGSSVDSGPAVLKGADAPTLILVSQSLFKTKSPVFPASGQSV